MTKSQIQKSNLKSLVQPKPKCKKKHKNKNDKDKN